MSNTNRDSRPPAPGKFQVTRSKPLAGVLIGLLVVVGIVPRLIWDRGERPVWVTVGGIAVGLMVLAFIITMSQIEKRKRTDE